ncbi:TPA: hypothetical protein ACOECQ_000792 [Stenotrophomonas maltophilia]
MTAPRARKPAKAEHAIQNEIRNELCDAGMFFRANVGTAWASNEVLTLADGTKMLRNPRPFSSGLPAGFPDLFGVVPVTITPDMVGTVVGVATFIECKSSTGVARKRQTDFGVTATSLGARHGFARCVEDARRIAAGLNQQFLRCAQDVNRVVEGLK